MIILAVEENEVVYAYNEQRKLFLQERGKLHGYTCKNVAIRRNKSIYVYDESGTVIAEYSKDFIDTSNIAGIIM